MTLKNYSTSHLYSLLSNEILNLKKIRNDLHWNLDISGYFNMNTS